MTTKQCCRLYGWMLLSYLPLQAALMLFWASAFGTGAPMAALGEGVMLAWMLGALWYYEVPRSSLFPVGRLSVSSCMGALAGGVLLTVANLLFLSLFALASSAGQENAVGTLLEQGAGTYLLMGVLLPAVVEEAVFRGGFYQQLRREQAAGVAALVSALFFAGMHFSLPHLVSGTVLGLCSAALWEGSGSLWPSVLLHGCFNGLPLLLNLPLGREMVPVLGMLLGLPAGVRGGLALVLAAAALLLCGGRKLVPRAAPQEGKAPSLWSGWMLLAVVVWCAVTGLLTAR